MCSTSSAGGNLVDGLPPAPSRACMCKPRRVFSSSGEVHEENVLVSLYFSDSYHIEASTRASEWSKCQDRQKVLSAWHFQKLSIWGVKYWNFWKIIKMSSEVNFLFGKPPRSTIRKHRDRKERLPKQQIIDQSKSFCTCPPSGNQIDGFTARPS
jgi:hypothetical protein